MIRRITLENYMSHGRTVIEPAAGLTVLVGPNNCGKSAIIHALQTLCYNKPNEYAIRHDEKEASVTVETDDGHVVTWRRRRGGAVCYEIDGGEPIYRLGQGGVPDGLHTILRMPRIDSIDDQASFLVHFGLQKSPIFLLDDPPARAATFFASNSDAERLLQMQRRHREKVRDARRDQAQVAREAEALGNKLDATVALTELTTRVGEAESVHREMESRERQSLALRGQIGALAKSMHVREGWQADASAIAPLRPLPALHELKPLRETIERINRQCVERCRAVASGAALERLAPPPSLADTGSLSACLVSLRRAQSLVRRDREQSARLASLREPPVLAEPSLREQVKAMRIAQELKRRQARRASHLQRLREPPQLAPLAPLQAVVGRFDELRSQIARANKSLATIDAQIETVREQGRRWAEDHPRCPTCGALTDADAVLAGGHAHER